MNKPRHSLSSRLSLGIMLMAVPIFMLSLGTFFVQSRKLYHQETTQRSMSILNNAIQRVASYMSAVENAAKSNAWLIEENFTPDSLLAISQRIVTRNQSIISCSVGAEPNMFPQMGRYFSVFTVNDGDTIFTVREPDYEYFEKMWYKTARKTDKACWINPFSDYNEATLDHNDAVASYSLPLHSHDGRITGIIATDFSFTRLAKVIMASEPPYPSAYYMLLGGDGRYLIHPKGNMLFKKTIFSDTNANDNADLIALGHEMTAGRNGTAHLTLDGEKCHVCYANVPGTDWSLALVDHSDEMMISYNRLAYIIVVLIVIGLLVIQWLCYRVVRQTITPINQLLDVTEKITNGQYDESIPLSKQNDAVAQLQNSFSAMQQSIMSHIGQIENTVQEIGKYNVEQEEKVEQAEEAIRRKNQFLSHVLSHVQKPLSGIRECGNVMRSYWPLPEKEKIEITSRMKQDTVTLHRMVLMLFDISETGSANSSQYIRGDKVLCNQLAQECVSFIQAHFRLKIRFETEIPDDLQVLTSRQYLKLTMRELLYNAAKYSDGKHIMMRIAQTPATVRFIVEDKGPGLPAELQEQIFQPFVKNDDQSEGLGLGLPLAKRHLVSLGGDLVYDADYKDGCRFIMELPK